MNVNANNSSFYFELPKGFLYPEVEKLFESAVKRMPLQYNDSLKYLNSTISGITIPGITAETTEQYLGKEPIQWKAGIYMHRWIEKEFTITFSLIDGFTNWMMLILNTESFLLDPKKEFLPDFYIRILDSKNYNIFTIKYSQVQIVDIPGHSLSWTDNTFNTKSFDVKFKFNKLEIRFDKD